jgi:hypothetical protein
MSRQFTAFGRLLYLPSVAEPGPARRGEGNLRHECDPSQAGEAVRHSFEDSSPGSVLTPPLSARTFGVCVARVLALSSEIPEGYTLPTLASKNSDDWTGEPSCRRQNWSSAAAPPAGEASENTSRTT